MSITPITEVAAPAREEARALTFGRWWQLVLGVICMSMIANLQYGWTLFVNPINDKYHWGAPAIQVAFTIFIVVETWLVPFEGYLVDRFGPKVVGVFAGLLVAAAWVVNSIADTLPLLYLGAVIGGVGAGAVYGACVGNALKWFPDRRGFAAGITAMGFGAGSALTVFPVAAMIRNEGYEAAFLKFGIAQGLVVFLIGWLLKAPDLSSAKAPGASAAKAPAPQHEYTPIEMLRTPAFWVMYVMFVMMATGGLIATAQLTPIARDFRIADSPVSLIGLTLPALTFALSLDRILNGVSRPFFGWVSDKIGREKTMCIAFAIEGACVLALSQFGNNPLAFVLLTGLVFFAYGEIYSLFPATCGDTYGKQFASANAGLLYTAKGSAALLVPLSSMIAVSAGGWRAVFVASAILCFIASGLALVALKPLRQRMVHAKR
jgi:OFA family oxalate/formate antiporter-like MFS transporter